MGVNSAKINADRLNLEDAKSGRINLDNIIGERVNFGTINSGRIKLDNINYINCHTVTVENEVC